MSFATYNGSNRTEPDSGKHVDFQVSTDPGSRGTAVQWSVSQSSGWQSVIVATNSQNAFNFGQPHPRSVQIKHSPSFKLINREEECKVLLRKGDNGTGISLYINISEWLSSISGQLVCLITHRQQIRPELVMAINKDTYSAGLGWGFKDILSQAQSGLFYSASSAASMSMNAGNFGYPYQPTSNDNLTIKLKIILAANNLFSPKYEHVANEKLSLLTHDLESLYKNGKFSDISLIVNDQPLRAHKAILSARSPVLAAMLDSDMSENRTNEIEINDLDVNVVKEMLRYMYTGQVEHLEEVAYGLLTAADKYGLDSLKVKCAASLAGNLSVQNVPQIFRLADLHGSDLLQKTAADFIKKNMGAVRKTEGWKLLKKSCPELVIDTFIEN